MFSITEFIMKTLKGMIGKYPDFQIREYALNWYSKGKLTEEDLAEIETLIEAQYIVPTPPVEDETADELIGDISTEESTEIENETILDDEEETQTEVEESQTETEIIEDSINEESTEQTEEVVEESTTEPTE